MEHRKTGNCIKEVHRYTILEIYWSICSQVVSSWTLSKIYYFLPNFQYHSRRFRSPRKNSWTKTGQNCLSICEGRRLLAPWILSDITQYTFRIIRKSFNNANSLISAQDQGSCFRFHRYSSIAHQAYFSQRGQAPRQSIEMLRGVCSSTGSYSRRYSHWTNTQVWTLWANVLAWRHLGCH